MLRESTDEEAEFLADPTFRFDLPVVLIIDPVTQQAKFIFKTGAEEQEGSKQSVLERTDTTDLVLRQDVKFCQFCDEPQSSCPHSMDKEKSHSAVLKCSAKFLSALTRRKSNAALAFDDSESAPSHQDAQPMTEVALGEVVAETHDLDHSSGKVETADSQPRMRLSRTLTSAWRSRELAPSHQDAQPMTEVALGEVVAETHDLDHSSGKVETADSQPRMRLSRTLTSAWRNRSITTAAA